MHESFYDVSLRLIWPSDFPAYVAYLPACDPLGAMVAYAAVQIPDKSIERWYSVRLEVFSREIV
jgi:hypothetical protein